MLTVYKASAGSGKTFRLVVEYLKLLLKGERNYRHILAVTFTNKATAEMKERVVEQLGQLASGKDTVYKKILAGETGMEEAAITQKAAKVLENILFDYNRFAVSTIDKFTQRVIKAFNREAGISPDFQIELDNGLIVDEAVDKLIASIGDNKALKVWLEDFISEKIRNNRNFSIEKDLKSLGTELFREKLQDKLATLNTFFSQPDNRKRYLEMLNGKIYGFEKTIREMAVAIENEYTAAGFSSDDFSNKLSGVAGFIRKTAMGTIPEEFGARTLDAAESDEKWIVKTHKRRNELLSLVNQSLNPLLNRLISYYHDNSESYFTAKAIKNSWYTMAVLLDMSNQIQTLNREKNILPLANSNLLLKSIIDGNETPFIYEKTGNAYQFFMLDEFQDTSGMQWENFRPLIGNSLSTGNTNLVVGDVKQSIYRWRNSNWNILASSIFNDFPGFDTEAYTLNSNHRSDEYIVKFNNSLFPVFVNQLADSETLKPVIDEYRPVFDSIYGDVLQNTAKAAKESGCVRVEFIGNDENNFKEESLERLACQVKTLQDNGFAAGEIAILVRTNVQGAEIVSYFMDIAGKPENESYNLKVLSNESLFLRSSPAVNFVVNIIRFLTNREEKMTRATLLHLYETLFDAGQSSVVQAAQWYQNIDWEPIFDQKILPLINRISGKVLTSSTDEIITRICAETGLFSHSPSIPFLQALIDKSAEIRKNMNNDLSNFLLWWDEKGQSESVRINEEVDAIRLLTIHKSKGLEFRAVLIPFFDWKLADFRRNILWCVPGEKPFNDVPLVPLSFGSILEKTIFAREYYHEYFNVLVDNINLAYVAFTRAKSVLMINLPVGGSKGTISQYFEKALDELMQKPDNSFLRRTSDTVLKAGELPSSEKLPVSQANAGATVWHFTPFDSRLGLRTDSEDFLQEAGGGITRKNLGKAIHSILSDIKSLEDVEESLRKAELAGILQSGELETVRAEINKMTRHPATANWFDGTYKVLNEKQLLTKTNVYRPDRIMIKGSEALVVDFKTGSKKPFHQSQVKKYCQVLTETGIQNVTGFLWYIQSNEIERVS
jgi:ATP-dependent helicase/nuclease subunit A